MMLIKRETAVVLTLSVIFLLLASWKLGLNEIPSSGWMASETAQVIVDLRSQMDVHEVIFMVQTDELHLEISSGAPGSWEKSIEASIEGYNQWRRVSVDSLTRFLRINFQRSEGEILEIIITGEDGRIRDPMVRGEDNCSDSFEALTDEQNLVQFPLTYLSESIFDEVYYVRAAVDYLSRRDPYEDTHPPLGKLIIASGISLFGNNPFGWRITGVLFSSAMIPVIYLLGKEISGLWLGGLFSALLFGFDFMRFTMGRMATIDTFLVFFSIASQLFFYRYLKKVLKEGWGASLWPLFAAIILSSLSFATKWTAALGLTAQFFTLGLIRFGFIRHEDGKKHAGEINRNVFLILLGLFATFLLVYSLTYMPYISLGHSWKDVFERQLYMLSYHSGLEVGHDFSSPWWSWPLLSRPVWLYISRIGNAWASTIVAMGNPAVWWIGLVVMIDETFRMVKERFYSQVFLVVMFVLQWLPFVLISRSLFLYHYYPNVPILCLVISGRMVSAWNKKKKRINIILYFLIVASVFALYYPVITGIPIYNSLRSVLRILKGWSF